MAVHQSPINRLNLRYRGQAPSHIWIWSALEGCVKP